MTSTALNGCLSMLLLGKLPSISSNNRSLCILDQGTLIAVLAILLNVIIISTWPLLFQKPNAMPGASTANPGPKRTANSESLNNVDTSIISVFLSEEILTSREYNEVVALPVFFLIFLFLSPFDPFLITLPSKFQQIYLNLLSYCKFRLRGILANY